VYGVLGQHGSSSGSVIGDGDDGYSRKRVTKVGTFTKVGTSARAHGQDIK
jgi:hypothetical protein